MTPRRGKAFRTSERVEDLAITHRHAAGIDVHARAHWVCVPAGSVPGSAPDQPTNLPANVALPAPDLMMPVGTAETKVTGVLDVVTSLRVAVMRPSVV